MDLVYEQLALLRLEELRLEAKRHLPVEQHCEHRQSGPSSAAADMAPWGLATAGFPR